MLQKGFLLACIAASLVLGACGTQNRFSGNADALLQAYSKKIEAEGYTYRVYEVDVPEKYTPGLQSTTALITGPNDGFSGAVYVQIEETQKGVRSVTLSFDPDSDNRNIDQITYLSGTLMQVCDSANGSGKAAAVRRAKAVITAADKAQVCEKNSFTYSVSLYSTGIDFEAVLPGENYALSAKEFAKVQGRTLRDIGRSESEIVADMNAVLGDYGYSLKDWDKRYDELYLERNDLLKDQPDIYAIVHKTGFVDGALLVYRDGETVYRVELQESRRYLFYLGFESEEKLLISCFHSALKDETAGDAASRAETLLGQITKAGRFEQDGIAYTYLYDYRGSTFTVEAAQP